MNHFVWVDIPATDLDRAMKFYSAVLKVEVKKEWPEMPVGVFQNKEGVSGCVYVDEDKEITPSQTGPLVYLNVNGRLTEAEKLVTKNSGRVLTPKHAIGPFGFRALCLDSEGNRIALHSEKDS